MPTPVIMPMLGLTMEEGAISEWLKNEGDHVEKDEPLFSVEMDKGIVEVPSPASGILAQIAVPTGQTVPVKTLIAQIAAPGEMVQPVSSTAAVAAARVSPEKAAAVTGRAASGQQSAVGTLSGRLFASPRARMRAREFGVDLTAVPGSGPRGRIVEEDVLSAARLSSGEATAATDRRATTPLARRLAAEHGLDLAAIPGTGPGGRVTQDDVLHAVEAWTAGTLAPGPQPPTPAIVQPLTRLRRITAERMAASTRSVARVTMFLEADLSEAVRFRSQLAPEFARLGVAKLPWDAILAKAAALALIEHPAVNAEWVEGQGIRRFTAANVGLAVALEPEGLVVPVLRDAHSRSLRELAGELLTLADKARLNRLTPREMEGATFTITNLGIYGIDGFTPIINPPQTAILGVGRIAEKPAVIDGRVEVRTQCTLSLSFDHRVLDGAPAAAFLQRLAELLSRPYALLEL